MNIPTEDGLFPGLTYEEYCAIPAVRHSFLVDMEQQSPMHAHYIAATGGQEDTHALMLGRALHLALLEPEKFDSEILATPEIDRRTKAGKIAWINFKRQAEGRITLEPGEMTRVREMARAVLGHEAARDLFSHKGVNEMTLVWTDRVSQVRCKARVDRWTAVKKQPILVDVKTCRDVKEHKFKKSLDDYGYNLQAAFYLMGAQTLQPIPDGSGYPRVFTWLAIESDGPFDIGVFQADTHIIEHGVMKLRALLKTYKECRATGVWPGKNGQGVVTIDNPEYVYKRDPIDGQLEEI